MAKGTWINRGVWQGPWFWNIANTTLFGKGHPGNSANFLMGDGHTEGYTPQTCWGLYPDSASFNTNFNAFYWWQ